MPSSTVSLEPLSSPSPSPPPQEENQTLSSNSNHSAGAGFDSGSELSELTEDEQDNDSSQQADEEHLPPRRKKKRDSIVPAPMWGWAKPKKDWKSKVMIEEEEEEEQAGPAKAMEEEEDEDHNDDTPLGTKPAPELDAGDNDDDDEDVPDLPDDVQEPEDESATVVHPQPIDSNEKDELLSDDEGEPELDPEPDDAPPAKPDARDPSPDPSEEENAEEDELGPTTTNIEDGPKDPNPAAESEDETGDGDEPAVPNGPSTEVITTPIIPTPVATLNTAPLDVSTATVDTDPTVTPMEVDIPNPPPVQPPPVAAVVAASSIMAGSEVVDPPSPSASASAVSATPRVSPSASRTPTPNPESEHEPETKAPTPRTPIEVPVSVARKPRNTRTTRNRSKRKLKADLALEDDADGDPPVDAEDHHIADPDDAEVDSPELELESDVQPAHRSEALDMLAQIELKFALLRERLYVEKMEGLAWEEALVAEGTHPELSHLHSELSKRRDKRLELASRRREFEMANITKRRKLDEDGVWSWWKNARDTLQVEMASEANRRRRKLDRERRAIDRPQPIRRIPSAPHNIHVPQTLREVIKLLPYDTSDDNLNHKHRQVQGSLSYPHLSTLSPEEMMRDLDFLSQQRRPIGGFDIRPGMIGPNSMFGPPPGLPHGFEPFNMGIPMIDGPALNRFGLPMQHLQVNQMQGPIPPGFPGPSGHGNRMQNHSAPPAPIGNVPHHQVHLDMEVIGRPSSGAPPLHAQLYSNPVPPPVSLHLNRRSISPPPVPYLHNGMGSSMPGGPSSSSSTSKTPSWMVPGTSGSLPHSGGTKEGKRLNGAEIGIQEREKEFVGRERISEGMKLRDGRDREIESDREGDRQYHMQHGLSHRHAPLQHPHQHNHSSTAPGLTGQHHHHSHHHHVHHHHHPPSGPGGPNHQQQSPNGPPPMNGLSGNTGGLSPHPLRDLEVRRPPSGASMEVIDVPTAQGSKQVITLPMGEMEYRERGRPLGPPPAGPHDRALSSFMMTPSQSASGFPQSPRNAPAASTAPGSIGPSRRGSWTEEQGLPRPGSSSSLGPSSNLPPPNSAGPSSHRHTPLARAAMTPPLPPQRTPMHSPPRSNGIRLPPLSPSAGEGGPMRSPLRAGQALPLPANSPSKMTSPEMAKLRRHSPPPQHSTRSPLMREQLSSGPVNPLGSMNSHSINPRTSSPITIFPPSSHSVPHQRLPTVGGVGSGRHSPALANPPKMNAVPPIDGS